MECLKNEINRKHREYYIKEVNEPLLRLLEMYSNRFPMPTDENVLHPNSRRLLEIQDKYNQYEGNTRRGRVIRALLRIGLNKIEHSPNYRDVFCWFVEEIRNGDWKSRTFGHPQVDWNEPKPYGGSR